MPQILTRIKTRLNPIPTRTDSVLPSPSHINQQDYLDDALDASTVYNRGIPPSRRPSHISGASHASSTDMVDSDVQRAIMLHDNARAEKGCPPLKWDDNLAADAEGYAIRLARKDKAVLQRSGDKGQGENLWMCTAAAAAAGEGGLEDAVRAWLEEGERYDGGEGKVEDCGRYTQCLWRNTTRFGMGKAMSLSGVTYVVARYTSPGNLVGEKPF